MDIILSLVGGVIATGGLVLLVLIEEAKKPAEKKSYEYWKVRKFELPSEHIGKDAEAFTALRPSGRIILDGERFEAISDMGFVELNTQVKIVDIRHYQYVVSPKDESSASV
jgi:membrane-bound ClpP family serine protease